MEKPNFFEFVEAETLVTWALWNLDMLGQENNLKDDEIRLIIRTIGSQAIDTVFPDDQPVFRRIGISLMLSVTLMAFPDYYVRYELSQFN